MARTYKRDSRGRFASGGGGGSSGGRKAAPVKLTRRTPVSQGGGRSRGHLVKRAAVAAAKGKLAAKDPADQSIKGTLSRRAQKGAVTRAEKALAAAKQGGRVRLSARAGVIRPGARKGAQPAVVIVAARPRRRKTDRQIVEQVSRISERAWGRDRTLSQRTLSILDKASGGVAARASRRMARATANEDRAWQKYNSVPGYPGTRTKTNRQRAERQGSARRAHRDLRDRAEWVQGDVRVNAELTASVKRDQYARSAAGKAARRKQRAAQDAASKAWVRGRR